MKRVKKVVVFTFATLALAVFAAQFAIEKGRAFYQQAAKPPADAPAAAAPAQASGPRDYKAKYDHFDDQKVNRNLVESHKALTDGQRCNICHTSIAVFVNPALESRPYHDGCVVCHAEQFTSPKLEICVSCHTTPISGKIDPNNKDVKISSLDEKTGFYRFSKELKDFGMEFSHNTHSRRAGWDCNTCHVTPADGKTKRSSFPNHPECYVCHKENDQPAKGGCQECHNKGAQAEAFYGKNRTQIDIAYDYFKFNHGQHLKEPRVGGRCDDCHDIINTDGKNSPDVSRIQLVFTTNPALLHKSVCFKCHNPNPSPTGGEKCEKCHAKPPGSLAASPPRGYIKPGANAAKK